MHIHDHVLILEYNKMFRYCPTFFPTDRPTDPKTSKIIRVLKAHKWLGID